MKDVEMAHHTTALFTVGDKDEFTPERFSGDNAKPPRHAETGINVLIVGSGVSGLMTAMECWRKGHNVVKILEKNEGPIYTGTP